MSDIPKLFTALAEWSACLVFVLNHRRRFSNAVTAVIMAVVFSVLANIQIGLGYASNFLDASNGLWLLGMLLVMLIMYLTILVCCRIPFADAGLDWAVAFLSAEFAAALEWQIYSLLSGGDAGSDAMPEGPYPFGMSAASNLFMLGFYLVFFLLLWHIEHRILAEDGSPGVSRGEFLSCVLLVAVVFALSNITYVFPDTPFSADSAEQLFYIRTLVDFAGLLMLLTQQYRLRGEMLREELANTNLLMRQQFEQYQFSKSNMEVLNRKYHDMKHQIDAIRAESDDEKREGYLKELEAGIEAYDSEFKTGNRVLDTVLTGKSMLCAQKGIQFLCVADGTLLEFMDTMDLCSIFGNALDNAMESTEKVEDRAKRIIRTAVYEQNAFVVIRFENYYEQAFETVESEGQRLPLTTKKDRISHGYGVRSIRLAAQKYCGTIAVTAEDNWFYLRILIPVK